jgi:hypothetical protein
MNNHPSRARLYWTEEQEIFQKLFGARFDEKSHFELVQTSQFGDF